MKSKVTVFSVVGLLAIVWTIYFLGRQSAINQYEEIHERLSKQRLLEITPETVSESLGPESLLHSMDEAKFKRVDEVTLKLHAAAALEFFRMSGITLKDIRQDYYYEVNTDSAEWISLLGEADNQAGATLIMAARVSNAEALASLIERRWKVPQKSWKPIGGIDVNDCSTCRAYEVKFKNETYALIVGKSESSDLVHAVAELGDGNNTRQLLESLAKRLHFSKSENF